MSEQKIIANVYGTIDVNAGILALAMMLWIGMMIVSWSMNNIADAIRETGRTSVEARDAD